MFFFRPSPRFKIRQIVQVSRVAGVSESRFLRIDEYRWDTTLKAWVYEGPLMKIGGRNGTSKLVFSASGKFLERSLVPIDGLE